jgi:hypothetical protein
MAKGCQGDKANQWASDFGMLAPGEGVS